MIPPEKAVLLDPTALTTAQLAKAIENADKLHESKLEIIREKLAGMDKAVVLSQAAISEKMTTGDMELTAHIQAQRESVAAALMSLKELLAEKDKATALAEAGRKEARDKAEKTLDTKLFEMNKFREQNAAERAHLVSREAHEGDVKQLTILIERNRSDMEQKVPRELYDNALVEWSKWRADVDGTRREDSGRDKGVSATGRIAISVVTTLAIVLGIINFFRTSNVIGNLPDSPGSSLTAPAAAPVEVINPPSKPVRTKKVEPSADE